MIDSESAWAVVSNATAKPAMTLGIDFSISCPESWPMAIVMPTTVPKNPKSGIVEATTRTVE